MTKTIIRIFFVLVFLSFTGIVTFELSNNNQKILGESVQTSPILENVPEPESSLEELIVPKGKFYAPIINYHHIAKVSPQNSYYVSPEIFDSQMKWLKDNHYTVISLDDLVAAAKEEQGLPQKPVVITFDDGLQDQFKKGYPILKKYGYTATFFVKLNNTNKGGLSWQDLKQLQSQGNIIGSHSLNHDNMSHMSTEQLQKELIESKRILEDNLGKEIKYFSYPGGEFSQNTIDEVKKAGYVAAVTTKHNVYQEIKNQDSLYTLPRLHIDDEMPTFIDWVQGKNLF